MLTGLRAARSATSRARPGLSIAALSSTGVDTTTSSKAPHADGESNWHDIFQSQLEKLSSDTPAVAEVDVKPCARSRDNRAHILKEMLTNLHEAEGQAVVAEAVPATALKPPRPLLRAASHPIRARHELSAALAQGKKPRASSAAESLAERDARRKVLRLYKSFSQDYPSSSGGVDMKRFEEHLAIYFPTANRARRQQLLDIVRPQQQRLELKLRFDGAARRRAQMLDLFGASDADGNGKIDKDELMSMAVGAGMTQAEGNALFQEQDADGNGTLDVEEFTHLVARSPRLFKHLDAMLQLGRDKRLNEIEQRRQMLLPALRRQAATDPTQPSESSFAPGGRAQPPNDSRKQRPSLAELRTAEMKQELMERARRNKASLSP